MSAWFIYSLMDLESYYIFYSVDINNYVFLDLFLPPDAVVNSLWTVVR